MNTEVKLRFRARAGQCWRVISLWPRADILIDNEVVGMGYTLSLGFWGWWLHLHIYALPRFPNKP